MKDDIIAKQRQWDLLILIIILVLLIIGLYPNILFVL